MTITKINCFSKYKFHINLAMIGYDYDSTFLNNNKNYRF